MRFSFIRTGLAATAAAVALAACGGHGMVPSQSVNPGGLPNFVSDSSNPCYTAAVQPAWIFHGSCVITKLPSKGKTIKLAAYKGFTETVTLPKNSGNNGTFVLVDAVGGSDISKYKGKAIPPLPSTVGKSALYVEAVNATPNLKFTAASLNFVTKGKFPGKTCTLSLLQKRGTKFSWVATPLSAPVKSGAVTYKIPYTSLGVFFPSGLPAGPLFFDIACK